MPVEDCFKAKIFSPAFVASDLCRVSVQVSATHLERCLGNASEQMRGRHQQANFKWAEV